MVSPQVLSNAIASYAKWRYETARARAKKWADEVWPESDEFQRLSDMYAKNKLDRETIYERTRKEHVARVIEELSEIKSYTLDSLYAEPAVRAGQARSLALMLPEDEQSKVLQHPITKSGLAGHTVGSLTNALGLRNPARWLWRALTESDFLVADKLDRSALLAIDAVEADMERRIQEEFRAGEREALLG